MKVKIKPNKVVFVGKGQLDPMNWFKSSTEMQFYYFQTHQLLTTTRTSYVLKNNFLLE